MARIVSVIGITHNPFMPRLFGRPDRPPGSETILERVALMQQKLTAANPEALVMVGNDHMNQFFMDNMPAFLLGKMEEYEGTFHNEVREFGLPEVRVKGDTTLSAEILAGALQNGIDLAYSNELRIDHSIIVPLLFARPDLDLPIVPILTNCIAPPLPAARRFYDVGRLLRKVIEGAPSTKRVAVVISGHLSLEVGGPKQFEGHPLDQEFDHRAVGWVADGDVDAAVAACDYGALQRLGNMSHGFLNFLLAMGVAHGDRNTHAEGVQAGWPSVPFFAWEPAA